MQVSAMQRLLHSAVFRIWTIVCAALLIADCIEFVRSGDAAGLYTIFGFIVLGFPVSVLLLGLLTVGSGVLFSHGLISANTGIPNDVYWMIAIWVALYFLATVQWFWATPKLLRHLGMMSDRGMKDE